MTDISATAAMTTIKGNGETSHAPRDTKDSDSICLLIVEKYLEQLSYESCVETNQPTPLIFAKENAKDVLAQSKGRQTVVTHLMKKLLVQPCNFAKVAPADLEAGIRAIQLQVVLRFQFWSSLGRPFLKQYKKLWTRPRRKRSAMVKKRNNSDHYVMHDIIEYLTFAAMKLPDSQPFKKFLFECLDKDFVTQLGSLLPKDVFSKLYNEFEIQDPGIASYEAYVMVTLTSRAAAVPPPCANKQTLVTSSASAESMQSKECLDKNSKKTATTTSAEGASKNSLLPQSVSLVAPINRKKNSLLAGGINNRSHFVGSHFNTNLTNMNTLFREVKTQSRNKRPSSGKTQQTRLSDSKQTEANGKLKDLKTSVANDHSQSMAGVKRKQCFQVAESSKAAKAKIAVQETPMHRAKSRSKQAQSARQVVFAARAALKRQG